MPFDSIRIGRIFGISIELHISFILLLLLALFLSPTLFLLVLLLYVCVFIHELSHAITAMNNKLKVSRIILNIWGGFTSIENLHLDPRVELNVAFVGPLTSLLLGGIFGVLVIFTPPGPITFLVQSLFALNVFLGFANFIPSFPMDGGRVLRSFLQETRNQFDATIATAKVSKVMIILIFIVSSIYVLLTNDSYLTKEFLLIFDFFILFFFWQATQAEVEMAKVKRYAGKMPLRSVMSKHFISVDPLASIGSLYNLIKSKHEQMVITKINNAYGFVDVTNRRLMGHAVKAADLFVKAPNLPLNTNVTDALLRMDADGVGVAIVVSNGVAVGIIDSKYIQSFISLHILNKQKRKVLKT